MTFDRTVSRQLSALALISLIGLTSSCSNEPAAPAKPRATGCPSRDAIIQGTHQTMLEDVVDKALESILFMEGRPSTVESARKQERVLVDSVTEFANAATTYVKDLKNPSLHGGVPCSGLEVEIADLYQMLYNGSARLLATVPTTEDAKERVRRLKDVQQMISEYTGQINSLRQKRR